ncbi:MAG: hypothetical protein AAB221_14830 [Bacteroidota bacterium]
MKKKNWILPGILAFLVFGSSLVVGFSSRASSKTEKNNATCCSEKKMKECSGKPFEPGEMSLDNLSTQFLSIPVLGY